MGRRSPSHIRAGAPVRRGSRAEQLARTEAPDWLSVRGALALARLHRDRPHWLGLRTALRSWEAILRDPAHRLVVPCNCGGYLECCPDPARLRPYLLSVAAVLPPRDARRLRRLLADLESRW